ncbi:ClpX C4-type zinc finger protein [Weissella viridescens]
MKNNTKKKCAVCGKSFTNKNSLLKNDNGTFICEECAAWYRPD